MCIKYRVIRFEELESTNTEANGVQYCGGDLLVAQYQTGGRGQRGSVWESERGENLLMSLVLEPRGVRVAEQFRICEIVSVAVCGAVNEVLQRRVGVTTAQALIKWPNDIVVCSGVEEGCSAQAQKIAGILIEHSFSSEWLGRSIIGVGLNVLQTEFGDHLAWPATSIALESYKGRGGKPQTPQKITPEMMLEKFCNHFSMVSKLPPTKLHQEYIENLWRTDNLYEFQDTQTSEKFSAKITAVDPNSGTLELQLPDSTTRHYLFKELKFL